jgi:gamma-polyglutamate synthase
MSSFYILLIIILAIFVLLFIEYRLHLKRIRKIPIRIHINGTRGKSSVTRLIGAGLRAGGIEGITKVTGTFPRLILQDGTETYIHRKATPNILEQLAIVKYASEQNVQALIMECMALQPQYQTTTEHMMVKSTIGVITNIRMDHLDVMGRTLEEIATTLGRTIPGNQVLFTAEKVMTKPLEKIARRRNTKVICVSESLVKDDEMTGFDYIEHRENVALALAVCEYAGVDRKTALKGMYQAIPDAGVLKRFVVESFGKKMIFYNAFAANDPDSTQMVWNKIRDEVGFEGPRLLLLNTRQDRPERARQLSEFAARRIGEEISYLILIGQSCDVVENMVTNYGLSSKKIIN